jgi:peroxiredoxin
MKKLIKFSLILLLLAIIAFLGYKITTKAQYKKDVENRIQNIPIFSFPSLQGTAFTNDHLSVGKNILFVYFNSECEHCQYEASEISKHLDQFHHTQIIFISYEPLESIRLFAEKYGLSNRDGVVFLQDKKGVFSEQFDANSIPYLLIYNKEHQLVKKYKGEVKIQAVLNHLN